MLSQKGPGLTVAIISGATKRALEKEQRPSDTKNEPEDEEVGPVSLKEMANEIIKAIKSGDSEALVEALCCFLQLEKEEPLESDEDDAEEAAEDKGKTDTERYTNNW